MIFNVNIIL